MFKKMVRNLFIGLVGAFLLWWVFGLILWIIGGGYR